MGKKGILAIAAILPLALLAWDWRKDWAMPGEVYRTLDFTVRAGIDRATGVFTKALDGENRNGQSEQDRIASFRAAAGEWRKVQVQSETGEFDERILSYALFMQGCACERAKDSNEAVRLYSEVIELYPDVAWVSVPARLRLGCIQSAMGDVRKSNETLAALLDEPASRGTQARAVALRIYGDRLWDAGKFADAEALWREILAPATKAEEWRRANARDKLVAVALARGDYSHFDDLVFMDVAKDAASRLEAVRKMLGTVAWVWLQARGWNDFAARAEKLYPKESERNKKLASSITAFLAWFEGQRALYDAAKDPTKYPMDLLRVATMSAKSETVEPRLKVVEGMIRGEGDAAKAARLAGAAKDLLFAARLYDLARRLPPLIKDPLAASFMRYQIESAAGKHAAAALCLEEYLAHKPEPGAAKSAKSSLAQIYRDNLGKYDKAIALYQEINDPPRTLWDLHATYWKAGKKADAYRMLVELESMFPGEAAAAFYTHAQHLEEDGDKKQAIAIYKRLLSQPEWKKTPQSSWAHQALERHGIATGGAVINEAR
ncbi:MAG: tetratricopeptide repeat protein [Kiritimatiellae bacterium]|nr:tetratricopeptide repeat protein [Kiritimatiellia bacterium]